MPCRWFLHPPPSCSQPSMVLLCRAANATQSLVSFRCCSQQPPRLCGAASSSLTLLLLPSLCFISAPCLPSSAPWRLHPCLHAAAGTVKKSFLGGTPAPSLERNMTCRCRTLQTGRQNRRHPSQKGLLHSQEVG